MRQNFRKCWNNHAAAHLFKIGKKDYKNRWVKRDLKYQEGKSKELPLPDVYLGNLNFIYLTNLQVLWTLKLKN